MFYFNVLVVSWKGKTVIRKALHPLNDCRHWVDRAGPYTVFCSTNNTADVFVLVSNLVSLQWFKMKTTFHCNWLNTIEHYIAKSITLRLMIHYTGETLWAMFLGNFGQCCHQRATRWDTRPRTDLKYPDRNLLPILNDRVPKQHCLKSSPMYQPKNTKSIYSNSMDGPPQDCFKIM